VIRDGRDVVASLRTHPRYRWEDGRRVETNIVNPWEACIDRWVRDTRTGLAWRGDDRVIEIRYEDLVTDPRGTLGRLLAWLGEPWDDVVLDFHRTHREAGSDRANPGVKRGIYRSAQGRWETDLPPAARRLFRPEAARLLVELGYATDDRWAGPSS
jgi:protein-tyrosine sulfotransferase